MVAVNQHREAAAARLCLRMGIHPSSCRKKIEYMRATNQIDDDARDTYLNALTTIIDMWDKEICVQIDECQPTDN